MRILSFLKEESAATAVEYAVMLAAILLTVVTAIASVGSGTGGMWGGNQSALNAVGFGS